MLVWLQLGGGMGKLFNSSGFVDSNVVSVPPGHGVEFASLPPFLRVLLSTDGTVTKSLESFFWEPVSVANVEQKEIVLKESLPFLGASKGQNVISRKVSLIGEQSELTFAFAQSYICLDKIPETVREDLSVGKLGIGELLRECGLETYRDIVDIGQSISESGELIWRTYLIVIDHQPVIQITESFPLSVYA